MKENAKVQRNAFVFIRVLKHKDDNSVAKCTYNLHRLLHLKMNSQE